MNIKMSDHTNPTYRPHRDPSFNRYRDQSSGGVDSFDFNGFYLRPTKNPKEDRRILARVYRTNKKVVEMDDNKPTHFGIILLDELDLVERNNQNSDFSSELQKALLDWLS